MTEVPVRALVLLAVFVIPVFSAVAPPPAPLGVGMTANTDHSITLAWYRPAEEGITAYNLFSCLTKDGEFTRVATVSERSAIHDKLPVDTTRFYKVSAVNAAGEGSLSTAVKGFTFTRSPGAPFPVRVAKNMCVSLGTTILSTPAPTAGRLDALVDGSDATSCTIPGPCEVKIKLDPAIAIADAPYLLLNFRSETAGKFFISYDTVWRAPRTYTVLESLDSTDGKDGTWTELVSGTNAYIDGVIVFPNHKPTWIALRNGTELQLCRLDLFRAAPAGQRNDSWIFTGDSLVVQDFSGGNPAAHGVWFSDLVRQRHPDRYPIVIQAARGGEVLDNTRSRMAKTLPVLSPPNGTDTATGTIVCWEAGFNDIGVGGGLWMGDKINKALGDAQDLCTANGLIIVPVRLEYSTMYLDRQTLEPAKYNVFVNTLQVNLAGTDVFCRTRAPYAVDPQTQLPFADYWTYTFRNHETALAKDGVHHTKAGSDGINQLWAEVAGRMIYGEHR